MDNKYYTPLIEEFHVDFEYEILSIYLTGLDSNATEQEAIDMSDAIEKYYDAQRPQEAPFHKTNWSNNKVRIDTKMIDLDRRIRQNRIRVKYLDKEDIESFGFVFVGKSIDLWFELKGEFERHSWTSYLIQMHYNINDKWLLINAIDRSDEIQIFNGIVNNKSELSFILKRLNIV